MKKIKEQYIKRIVERVLIPYLTGFKEINLSITAKENRDIVGSKLIQ